MKIVPLLQIVNQNTGINKNSLNSETLSFSDFLVTNKEVKVLPSMEKHVESSKSLTFQQISDELTRFLVNHSLDQVEIKSRLHIDDEADGIGLTMISLLENEINESLNQANSIDELIEKTMSSSSTVAVLSLVTVMEDISIEQNVDFTPFISKFNHLLELEFPSYSNKDTVRLTSMLQAIDQMESKDRALVEGQLLLTHWTEGEDTTRILNLEKLLNINKRITEEKRMPMQETQVKNEILNEIFAFSSEEKLDSRMKDFFWEIDFTTLQLIINKTVKSIFNDTKIEFKENKYVNRDQFMSIELTKTSNDDRLLNEFQLESKNQSLIPWHNWIKGEEINEISSGKVRKEKIEEREDGPSIKTFEATINLLYSELSQVSGTSEIDLSHIFEEFVSLLNQYTSSNEDSKQLEKNVPNDFTQNMNVIEQMQMGSETSVDRIDNHLYRIQEPFVLKDDGLKAKISLETQLPFGGILEQPKAAQPPFDGIFEQPKAMPIMDNIMEISKTIDQVASGLSVDADEVVSELEKIVQDYRHLSNLNPHDQQLANNLAQHEVMRQMVPLMKSVRQFIKGMELLSTEKSIDLPAIFSKIENSLQIELFKFEKAGQKIALINDVSLLNEILVSNLSKRDEGKSRKQSLGDNEAISAKSTIPTASLLSTAKPFELLNQQTMDLAFPQIQASKMTKTVEANEEMISIHLDKYIPNQLGTQQESQKTELPMRQEFTNQLLNAIKTSKFAQLPNGANRLVIKLNPEQLGSLTVKLVQKNGEMIARIMASTESAKELLEHSVHQLKQALPSVQIEIERFEIFTEPFTRDLREQPNHKNKNEKEHEATDHEDEQENERSFIDSLNEALNITV